MIQAQYRRVLETRGDQSELVQALSKTGTDRMAARAMLRTAFEAPENQGLIRMRSIAFAADAYGDRDLALDAQRRAIEKFDAYGIFFQLPYSGMRSDPRFKALLREQGVYDFWRTTGKWSDFCKPVGADDFECR